MWISYTDKEVERFHPICQDALEKALEEIGVGNIYQVLHHQFIGPLEMDLVIQNKSNLKYLCVIEVKRTISSVRSTRNQFQAMSYVQAMPPALIEKPFYMITNLECSCMFRYDQARQNVFQQMLTPGIVLNKKFDEINEASFRTLLVAHYKSFILQILDNSYEYSSTIQDFINQVNVIRTSSSKWKAGLAIMFYEYIRGSLNTLGRRGLKDVKILNQQIDAVCREGSKINFKEIFLHPTDDYQKDFRLPSNLLSNLFISGGHNISADEITTAMHLVLSKGHEHDGEVPTDIELAHLLLILSKKICGNIDNDKKICDPAAGSGNLLTCIGDVFNNIQPKQLVANDINPYLLELLSLRLGLNFPQFISKTNSPLITTENICNLETDYFKNVQLLILNPPFVSAIKSLQRKSEIFERIRSITGCAPITDVGQMSLEGPFIELIQKLLPVGSTFACIIPKTHLTARGEASVSLRNFFTSEFGLQIVCSYPGTGIFNDVTKDTIIVIGKKGEIAANVKFISLFDRISDVDTEALNQALSNFENSKDFEVHGSGFEIRDLTNEHLISLNTDGWRFYSSETAAAHQFQNSIFSDRSKFTLINTSKYRLKRGKIGNKGVSDILYITSLPEYYKSIKDLIEDSLYPGMRMAKQNNILVDNGDQWFLNVDHLDDEVIIEIVNKYEEYKRKPGKQIKKDKSVEEIISILKAEAKSLTRAHSLLIPRNIRKNGSVYRCTKDTYVSTNFFIIENISQLESLVLSTWMSTVFYQLNCELSSKNQEGTRKMEEVDFYNTYIPRINNLREESIDKLKKVKFENFISLSNPTSSAADKVWAEILFQDKSKEILEEAISLLSTIALLRNS